MKTILLTGGAGYIGSHIAVELLSDNFQVIIVDNLCNSSVESIKRVEQITGKKVQFYKADVRDKKSLNAIFTENDIDTVIHLAGLKAVGESVEKPSLYYDNNLISTLSLIEVMDKYGVKKLVFSSSATVYGDPKQVPITELDPIGIKLTNPYGKTKYFIEEILSDLVKTNTGWQITSLRYFNPIGAHHSGLIGEDPNGIPNNLMPYISQVAVGKRKHLSVFGNDYPTPDGTGVRDYVHVVDLALAHVMSVQNPTNPDVYRALNIGTGCGVSVLELVKTFEKATSVNIPYKITDRRPGDIAECYADSTLASKLIGWQAQKTLAQACIDSWNWQSKNPNGYTHLRGNLVSS